MFWKKVTCFSCGKKILARKSQCIVALVGGGFSAYFCDEHRLPDDALHIMQNKDGQWGYETKQMFVDRVYEKTKRTPIKEVER